MWFRYRRVIGIWAILVMSVLLINSGIALGSQSSSVYRDPLFLLSFEVPSSMSKTAFADTDINSRIIRAVYSSTIEGLSGILVVTAADLGKETDTVTLYDSALSAFFGNKELSTQARIRQYGELSVGEIEAESKVGTGTKLTGGSVRTTRVTNLFVNGRYAYQFILTCKSENKEVLQGIVQSIIATVKLEPKATDILIRQGYNVIKNLDVNYKSDYIIMNQSREFRMVSEAKIVSYNANKEEYSYTIAAEKVFRIVDSKRKAESDYVIVMMDTSNYWSVPSNYFIDNMDSFITNNDYVFSPSSTLQNGRTLKEEWVNYLSLSMFKN